MATTLVRKVMLKIAADDGDTEAKLDKISAKADELAARHPDLKVRIDTAAASAKLAVLRRELKDTGTQSDKTGFSVKGLGGALNDLTLGIPTGVGEMGMFGKALAAVNLATGLGEPLVASLTVGVMGLGAGLVSAGAGLGVFGLVAKSNLTAAMTAANAVQTAQIAYNASIATGAKQSTAYAAEQKAIREAYAQLSPAQIAMAGQLGNAQNAWQSFVQSNTSGVDKILTQGIGLLPGLFRDMQAFMGPTEKALGGLVSQLGKGLGSAGFKSWIDAFAKASGPNLANLGQAVGHVAVGIGGILKAFLPMSETMTGGLDKLTAKFATWGTTLSSHSGFQSLVSMAKSDAPLLGQIFRNLGEAVKNLGSDMAGLSTFSNSRGLLQMAVPLSSLIKAISGHPDLVNLALWGYTAYGGLSKAHAGLASVKDGLDALKKARQTLADFGSGFSDAAKAADEATGAAGTWGGKLSGVLQKLGLMKTAQAEATAATEGETVAQEGLDGAMDANPIGLIVIAIAALVVAFALLWKHSAAFRDFWKTALKDVEKAGVAAWHFIDSDMLRPLMSGIDKVVSFVRSHWRTLAVILATVLLGPIGGLVAFIATHWAQFRNLTSRVVDDVTGFFERLPGRIMGAIRALPGMMLSAGRNIISMLAQGLESMAMAPVHAVEGIVSDVRNLLPFSPAKKGPLSGSGSPDLAGAKISRMIATGMTSGEGYVAAAATRVARAAQIGSAAGHPALAGAGGYGGGGTLRLEWVGGSADQALITLLKRHIRVTGGDPTVLGR